MQTNNDRYTFTPTASVSIVDGDFIESNPGSSQRNANVSKSLQQWKYLTINVKSIQAQIPIIPAARVITVGEAEPVAWWVIFLPILAAVVIISVVTILLWVVSYNLIVICMPFCLYWGFPLPPHS